MLSFSVTPDRIGNAAMLGDIIIARETVLREARMKTRHRLIISGTLWCMACCICSGSIMKQMRKQTKWNRSNG